MIEIDKVGDYYYDCSGFNHWVILDDRYYPLVDEYHDDSNVVAFYGLNKQPQKRIFTLCVEGWV